MAKFRKHTGGGLEQSLKTIIHVNSLEDVRIYYTQDLTGVSVENLTCELYNKEEDQRIPEWGETYIISATVDGLKVPIGWANDMLT